MTENRTLTSPSPPGVEPGTVLVETERLIVRRYLPTDAPALAEAANYRAVWEKMTDRFPSPYRVSDAEEYIRIGGISPGGPLRPPEYPSVAGIFLKEDQQGGRGKQVLIGSVGVRHGQDINYRTWTLGYFLTPSAWGKGYATEAVSAYVRWMLETWPGLARVEADTYDFNDRSRRVLEKIGFVQEGMKRGSAEKEGKLVGEFMYGLLRQDLLKE